MPHPLLDVQQLLHAEQQAEQRALTALRGASFHDCLTMHDIAPEREARTLEGHTVTLEGHTVTLRGSDIYDHCTWKKFLTSINQAEMLLQLTGVSAEVIRAYTTWLQHEHTGHYYALSIEADLA